MKFINFKKPSLAKRIIKFYSENPDELTKSSNDELKDLKKIIEVSQDYFKNLGMLGIGISVVFSALTLYVNNLVTTVANSKQAAVIVVILLAAFFFNQINNAIIKQSQLSAILKTIEFILEQRSEIKRVRISRLEKKYLKK